jgi:hypothetical protein
LSPDPATLTELKAAFLAFSESTGVTVVDGVNLTADSFYSSQGRIDPTFEGTRASCITLTISITTTTTTTTQTLYIYIYIYIYTYTNPLHSLPLNTPQLPFPFRCNLTDAIHMDHTEKIYIYIYRLQ